MPSGQKVLEISGGYDSTCAYLDDGNISSGIDKLLTTINLVNDESAAEANYLLAKIFYDH